MNETTTLLFVDHTPFAGGAQLVLAEHIHELDKNRFNVVVACSNTVPSLIERYQAAGAKTIVMPFPTLRRVSPMVVVDFVRAVRSLRQIIKDTQAELVISNTTRASYVCSIAVLGLPVKLIWWVRDFLYPKVLFRLLKFIPVKIICVSKSIKQAYMHEDDPQGEVVYVANSIYKRLPVITSRHIKEARDHWGIKPNDVVVGFMGRLVAEKGAEDVVRAVASVVKDYPRLKLLIIGTGKGQMHDVEGDLKKLVKDNQLQNTIVFTGYQEDEALYYSLIDIFVLATRDREPFATSVVQAMMAKCAVIGTRAGGTPELIKHEQTGLLYQPGNVQELAEQIRALLLNEELQRRISTAGYDHVLQYHREETVTDQLEELYHQSCATS